MAIDSSVPVTKIIIDGNFATIPYGTHNVIVTPGSDNTISMAIETATTKPVFATGVWTPTTDTPLFTLDTTQIGFIPEYFIISAPDVRLSLLETSAVCGLFMYNNYSTQYKAMAMNRDPDNQISVAWTQNPGQKISIENNLFKVNIAAFSAVLFRSGYEYQWMAQGSTGGA